MNKFFYILFLAIFIGNTSKSEPVSILVGVAAGLTIANYAAKTGKWAWGRWKGSKSHDDPAKKALENAEKEKISLQKEVANLKLEHANLHQKLNEINAKETLTVTEKSELEAKYREMLVKIGLAEQTLYLCYIKCLKELGKEQCNFIEVMLNNVAN